MSTTTGNVRISELNALTTIDNGTKLKIPVSKDKSTTSTPDWESYSVSASVLSNFMNSSLGLNTVKTDITNLKNNLTTQTNNLSGLLAHLGKYNLVDTINITPKPGYISIHGEKVTDSNYWVSNEVPLKQGCLYFFRLRSGATINNPNLSFISKVSTHEYDTDTETLYDTVYEPLPTHYHSNEYGAASNYLVFLATEDMNVVFCGHGSETTNISEVKYGAFIQIAENLLSINGEMMKVIVEAITKNRKDIESLYEKTRSLGDIHVTSIDSDEYPSVQGEPMVIVADRRPNTPDNTHGLDVPNRIGQIWIDKSKGNAYIATSLGNLNGWKQITLN